MQPISVKTSKVFALLKIMLKRKERAHKFVPEFSEGEIFYEFRQQH